MFIKAIKTSILTSDKYMYKLLKGTEILMPQDTHQSLCAEQEENSPGAC